jgi:hypothetical protein
MPKPRKLRAASDKIAIGTCVENKMIIAGIVLGRICRVMIFVVGLPIATAAFTYIFSLMLITALLIILEASIPCTNPMAIITCHIPGPTTDIAAR